MTRRILARLVPVDVLVTHQNRLAAADWAVRAYPPKWQDATLRFAAKNFSLREGILSVSYPNGTGRMDTTSTKKPRLPDIFGNSSPVQYVLLPILARTTHVIIFSEPVSTRFTVEPVGMQIMSSRTSLLLPISNFAFLPRSIRLFMVKSVIKSASATAASPKSRS